MKLSKQNYKRININEHIRNDLTYKKILLSHRRY